MNNLEAANAAVGHTPKDIKGLVLSVALHEGYREHPYRDTEGYWTIGFGTNIDFYYTEYNKVPWYLQTFIGKVNKLIADVSVSQREARKWAGDEAWFKLHQDQQDVLSEMVYQLGLPKFNRFVKTKQVVQELKFDEFVQNAMDSKWARQVPRRAENLMNKWKFAKGVGK